MMMSAAASVGMGRVLFLLEGGAGLAKSVEDGATAVHLKAVVGGYVGQKLLADGTFQMNEGIADHAFQMEMVAAIPLSHVLVHVGGLGITSVFPYRSLGAKLGEVAV